MSKKKDRVSITPRFKNTIEDYFKKSSSLSKNQVCTRIAVTLSFFNDLFCGKAKTMKRDTYKELRLIVGPDRLTVVGETFLEMLSFLKKRLGESDASLSKRLGKYSTWASKVRTGRLRRIESLDYDKVTSLFSFIHERETPEAWNEDSSVVETVSFNIGGTTIEADTEEMRKRGKKIIDRALEGGEEVMETILAHAPKEKKEEELPLNILQLFVSCECGSDLEASLYSGDTIQVKPCENCMQTSASKANEKLRKLQTIINEPEPETDLFPDLI